MMVKLANKKTYAPRNAVRPCFTSLTSQVWQQPFNGSINFCKLPGRMLNIAP
jgi:hypothetical protein